MKDAYVSLLQKHLIAGHISRRNFVKRAAALGLSIPAISAALAACGGGDDDDTEDTGDEASGSEETPATGADEPTATSEDVTVNQNLTATPTEEEEEEESSGATEEVEPTATATTEQADGQAGGSVTFSRGEDSRNMDPVTNDGNVNIWVFMNIYDQLVRVNEDGTGLEPALAEDWEVSDDGLTYTFTIRSGVQFYDGTDMTVDDIIWSIERAKTNEESIWSFTLTALEDITAPDDSTVVMTLNQKWAPFLADIAMFNSSIISQAFAEEVGEAALVDQTMGTGPFHMQEWNKGESMTLVKNPNFWEDGLPMLDEIVLTVVPDDNSRILQLQGGEIDGIIGQGDIPLNRISDLESAENITVHQFLSTWNNFVVLNTRDAPLDDVNVRQALNYAVDKEALIENVLFGVGQVANSYIPVGALFWNEEQEGYPYDLEQAQSLVAESNHPDGIEFGIQIRSGDQQQLQIATALKDMWSQINANLEIQQLEAGVLTDNYRSNNFDSRLSGWTNDIIDPDQLASYAILPEQTENYHTGWTNEEAISLAQEARNTLDPDERRDMYHRIQEIHMNDAPFIYLYVLPYVDVLNSDIQDYFHHPMGQYVFKRMYVEE